MFFFGSKRARYPIESNRGLLTNGMICRLFISMLRQQFEPGSFQLNESNPALIDGLFKRHVEFEAGSRELQLEDYGEYYLKPHVTGMVSLLRLTGSCYETFNSSLPEARSQSMCWTRLQYDGLSLMLIERGETLRIEVLFRPKTVVFCEPYPIYRRTG